MSIYHSRHTGEAVDSAVDKALTALQAEDIDSTLSASGKAADSKTAGDAISEVRNKLDDVVAHSNLESFADIAGYYIGTSGTTTHSSLRCSDYIRIPDSAIGVRIFAKMTSSDNTLVDINPFAVLYDENKNYLSSLYNYSAGVTVGADNRATYLFSQAELGNARFIRFNQSGKPADSAYNYFSFIYLGMNDVAQLVGLVGSYSGAFTSKTTLTTQILMKAGRKYLVRFYKPRSSRITLFGESNSSVYNTIYQYQDKVTVFNSSSADRYLCLYNLDGDPDEIDIKVFETDSFEERAENMPKKYIVSKDIHNADFTSFTACLLALKDDSTPKIIEVWEGDYDIYQEYQDCEVPVYTGDNPSMEYFDYCVWIPKNTHVIGKGLVRLLWTPDTTNNPEITWKQCYAVSPVNCAASMTLENVEIHCKNGRYCIHNDTIGLAPYAGAVQRFINVKCYKYAGETDTTTSPGESHAYGTSQAVGFGMNRSMLHYYENCEFHNESAGRAFYGHTNALYNGTAITSVQSGEIIMKNCIMDTAGSECVKLGNTGGVQRRVRVKFNNCWFSGKINVIDEAGTAALPNAYDITFLNCGDVSLHIGDPNNPHTPKAYNTTVTNV